MLPSVHRSVSLPMALLCLLAHLVAKPPNAQAAGLPEGVSQPLVLAPGPGNPYANPHLRSHAQVAPGI